MMRPRRFTTLAVLALVAPAAFAATAYDLDRAHSEVGFKVRHFGISTVRGEFTEFDLDLTLDEEDLTGSSVEVTIDADSIDTGNGQRDEHLRSSDFLAVDEHPQIIFKSTSIAEQGDGEYLVAGELTIRGVTREVELPVTFGGPIPGREGSKRIGIEGELTIDRQEYGVSWSRTLDTGGLVVANEVRISFSVEATHQPAAAEGP